MKLEKNLIIISSSVIARALAKQRKAIIEYKNKCIVCRERFITNKANRILCKNHECTKTYIRIHARITAAQQTIFKCKQCGKEYKRVYGTKKQFCSTVCRDASLRAIKYNSKTLQRFEHKNGKYAKASKIFERDKWKCIKCGISTPIELRGLNKDNSPELDHIIPISKGGNHDVTNLQCLCRRCNRNKGINVKPVEIL